jgi:hypothetical protein
MGPGGLTLHRFDVEEGNLLAALEWMLDQQDGAGSLRLCNGLVSRWDSHGR